MIEATLTLLPREARRRWKGSIGVDATLVRSFARGPKRPKGQTRRGKKREIMVHSVDPDAGWYSREKDERDDGTEQRPGMDKPAYGYNLALAVAAPDDGSEDADFPSVIMGMAVLDRPSHEPGRNGTRALASVRARGHPAHYLAADRAYSSAKAEDFQLPVRALGYRPVYDYKVDQLGVKAAACGFLQVEGQWVCPMMPQPLIDATADYRAKRIDRSTYEARLAERQRYRARRKGKPDVEGHVRLFCPAAGPHPLARCERKPASIRRAPAGSARIVLPAQADELRPECCVQETVTVAPEAGAKFAQDLPYRALSGRTGTTPFGTPPRVRTDSSRILPTRHSMTEGDGGSTGSPRRASWWRSSSWRRMYARSAAFSNGRPSSTARCAGFLGAGGLVRSRIGILRRRGSIGIRSPIPLVCLTSS